MENLVERIKRYISKRANLARNMKTLEKFLDKNHGFSFYGLPNREADQNNHYLISNLSTRKDICNRITNPKETKEKLFEKLVKMPHTYRERKWPYYDSFSKFQYSEQPSNVHCLTPAQLLRVWVIIKALEKQEFINHIGGLIENNLKDPYTEHGGLIRFDEELFDGKGLKLLNVESILAQEKNISNKGTYIMPFRAKDLPHVAEYHFHASKEDESKCAGPSQGKLIFRVKKGKRFLSKGTGDIAATISEAIYNRESHELVITKLKGKNFNIDYYGCEALFEGDLEEGDEETYSYVVLDLGDYEYGK